MAPVRVLLAMLLAAMSVSAQSPPLPDEDQFFAEARKRLASNDLLQSRYSYRERSTELRLNPFGRMGTGAVLVHEIYPHPEDELTYRRLVERDARPLSQADLAAQDAEYREKLAAWQRQIARENTSDRALRLKKAAEARAKDAALAREAIDVFEFRIVGRETREGEPALVISFSPRPGASARSREGRVARAFAGRAWVHEHEYEVMHVEATAIEDANFGFGLVARLHKGSQVQFTRRRVNGVWLPVETHFKGTGRALLVRKVVIDFSREYFDYRPFDFDELPARLGWSP